MSQRWIVCGMIAFLATLGPATTNSPADTPATPPAEEPAKVYVPYDKLKSVFEGANQGVFLPYAEFQRLWQAAQGAPANVAPLPTPYLISTARFTGKVNSELASMQLELTLDVLTDEWVEVPLGLDEAAVVKAQFDATAGKAETPVIIEPKDPKADLRVLPDGSLAPDRGAKVEPAEPLLRVRDGQYWLLNKGKGRKVLRIDFMRQLVTQPGLNLLSFKTPAAVITTLDLLIPDENMKVDVKPMLAASTAQVDGPDKKRATQLQAFLGAGGAVELRWKPTTQAAEELAPVILCDQLSHIHVAEALINYDVVLNYDIRRRGVDTFTVQLPGDFRVTAVEGENISKWDVAGGATTAPDGAKPEGEAKSQHVVVKLFAPAKDRYTLTVKMERFLKDNQSQVALQPVVTMQAIRQTGLLAISRSPRRSVELKDVKNLARVDVGRLPEGLRTIPDIINYRFIGADYGATLAIDVVEPRIAVDERWQLGVDVDRLDLAGQLTYSVERVGIFQVAIQLPDVPVNWQEIRVGPADLVERQEVVGKGRDRVVNVLFRSERMGAFTLTINAQANRPAADAPVEFEVPQPIGQGGPAAAAPAAPVAPAKSLHSLQGQVVLMLAEQLRAEVDKVNQLRPLPLGSVSAPPMRNLAPAMAWEFRGADRSAQATAIGGRLKMTVKPPQVSAVVHRLVSIEPGSIQQEAQVHYRVQFAPVDTFYLKMPAALADGGIEISGPNIKEKPRASELPADQRGSEATTAPDDKPWAYFKVVLQSPVGGDYTLTVSARRAFQAGASVAQIAVDPILAAGNLSDQHGTIAIAKGESLALGQTTASANLVPCDPSDANDLPIAAYRQVAMLAFKYSSPPFALSVQVAAPKEADVFLVVATGAIIEQVIAADGTLNTHATYVLSYSRGDRFVFTLPAGAEKRIFDVKLNGNPAELGLLLGKGQEQQRAVRLPQSGGQAAHAVFEISYGIEKPAADATTAIILPENLPVQQTIWRLVAPPSQVMLSHPADLADLTDAEAEQKAAKLIKAFAPNWAWSYTNQGRIYNFLRQGQPGKLNVLLVSNLAFSIGCWLAVLVVGLLMLPMTGFQRSIAVLLLAFGGLVAVLFVPLLCRQAANVGTGAAVIVALIWLVQWFFKRVGRGWRSRPDVPPKPAAATVPSTPPDGPNDEAKA